MNRNHKLILNLQNFAVQTTTLHATGNDLSPEMKTYYDKELIRLAEPELVHDQFAQKKNIPANGGKTIEFRKFDSLAKATTPLTEGVTPNGNKLNVSTVTSTVEQYGDYITISDLLELTAIDKVVLEALNQLGGQAGRTLDSITRDVVNSGTNVIYAGGVTSRASLTAVAEPDLFFKAAAQLKNFNAKKIEGSFVAIVHPFVAYDLMRDDEWIDVSKYAAGEHIFNGELGKIGGVRFVESTEAKVWNDNTCPTNTDASSGYNAVFSTLVIGADAYATTEVEGGGLQTIIKQKGSAGTADPLDQRSSVGWKAVKTAEILVEQYMVRVESLSSYSATTSAN